MRLVKNTSLFWAWRRILKKSFLFVLKCTCSSFHVWRKPDLSLCCREQAATDVAGGGWRRDRLLIGPGSRPPRCTSRCGTCTPCYPVHVSVPPWQQQQADAAEYYPEAWRCLCRGRLYLPWLLLHPPTLRRLDRECTRLRSKTSTTYFILSH